MTDRELEILHLLKQGKTNKEIGEVLGISQNTVKTHLKSVFSKLGVNNRTAACMVSLQKNQVNS